MPAFAYTAPPVPVTSYSTLPDDRRSLVARARHAQRRALRVFPPATAEVVQDELESFVDLGARYGGTDRIAQLIAEIDALPVR